MTCDCCRESQLLVYCKSGDVRVRLCVPCADAGHHRDHCLICGEPCWHCARVAHFADAHPRTLAKLANDPFDETKLKPIQKQLGTVYLS